MSVDLLTLSWAAWVGFLMSAPIGPVSLLAIRRALSGAPYASFATGAGVVICDLMVATAGLTGLQAVHPMLDSRSGLLLVACGIILTAAAVSGLRKKAGDFATAEPADQSRAKRAAELGAMTLQGLVVTLGNPLNAAAVMTIAAGLLRVERASDIPALVAALGLGCLAWWAGLAIGVYRLRHLAKARALMILNAIISLALGLVGMIAFAFGAASLLAFFAR